MTTPVRVDTPDPAGRASVADVEVFLGWTGAGLRFEGRGRSAVGLSMDGDREDAPSPVETLLLSLAGCMAADLVDIGGRMRLPIESVEVHGTGDRRTEPPRRYTGVRLVFSVGGVPESDEAKLRRALELSAEKYCSVMHTLRPDLPIETELVLASTAHPGAEADE